MPFNSRHLHRTTLLGFTITAFLAIAFLFNEKNVQAGLFDQALAGQIALTNISESRSKKYPTPDSNPEAAYKRLDLAEKECTDTFPDLTRDIIEASQRGEFLLNKSDPDYKGFVQGRINDNHVRRSAHGNSLQNCLGILTESVKLYILSTAPDFTPEIIHQRTAILHQIHRAILTSPNPLPDTHFAFVINDNPRNNSWAFSRPNKVSSHNTWLMPLFGFWSWKSHSTGLGTMEEVLDRIRSVEDSTPWEKKSNKVVWRGTPWFNPLGYQHLRQDLLKATKEQPWADVQALNKDAGGNLLSIEDFCKHKYVIYTEGVTYSGRLPYHQACKSVLITAPLTHLTHTAWWMRPITAKTLMASGAQKHTDEANANQTMHSHFKPLLPTVLDWKQANAIYVDPSFTDLGSVISFLEQNPHIAKTISRNQREVLVMRGYLSPGAESCYWRALIRAWAGQAIISDEWGEDVGIRFEEWITREILHGKSERLRGKIELERSARQPCR
ncbi:hypothetical protein P154DRAFT_481817 [Amniculicola lignicola CBS 123094]|uniref:Glycosyl transferase CAP10 domain-containing protein n=1 Tax=Amniculicola lignicola CBS 123094 TaxID=1392246 RepID=A0A6A5X0N2_9PLEO|nr:hypothetical protein P154DRAFT_481817 [Amniculicola lignicola CBS 123094]